ncbi:MAG: hypothetical protein GXW85_04900 [Clostridia bacterium]|nr:hypothetical protein [Clostridia bacterium]
MPSLRDYFFSDLSVFLNLEEFAEIHNINGVDVPAIVDSDTYKILSNNKSERFDGIYSGEVAIFVKACDLPHRPVFGEHLRLDDKLYLVKECNENMGILEIILGANES